MRFSLLASPCLATSDQTAIMALEAFRFSFLDMEILGAYSYDIGTIANQHALVVTTWKDFQDLRDDARQGAHSRLLSNTCLHNACTMSKRMHCGQRESRRLCGRHIPAHAGAAEAGWSCTNAKKDDGTGAVDYFEKDRYPVTYPPHECVDGVLARPPPTRCQLQEAAQDHQIQDAVGRAQGRL